MKVGRKNKITAIAEKKGHIMPIGKTLNLILKKRARCSIKEMYWSCKDKQFNTLLF
jgi:hypothetical protein